MELQRREFLKLGGVATGVSSAFGVVHAASASRQAVTSSSERIAPVIYNVSRYVTLLVNKGTRPKFFVVVGP
jgi:3-phosphoglycerate kinase